MTPILMPRPRRPCACQAVVAVLATPSVVTDCFSRCSRVLTYRTSLRAAIGSIVAGARSASISPGTAPRTRPPAVAMAARVGRERETVGSNGAFRQMPSQLECDLGMFVGDRRIRTGGGGLRAEQDPAEDQDAGAEVRSTHDALPRP